MKKKKNKKISSEISSEMSEKLSNKDDENNKKIILFGYLILIILILADLILTGIINRKEAFAKELRREEEIYNTIKKSYNKYIITTNNISIYKLDNNKYEKHGTISKDTQLVLQDKKIKNYKDEYFKLENIDYYVKYSDIKPIKEFKNEQRYKNYIPFNQNVITKKPAVLYSDNGNTYIIDEELNKPILIKDSNKYYIEYDNKLLYIDYKDIREIKESNNTTAPETNGIAVILYHYVYGDYDKKECTNQVICHSIPQVRSHFDYLKQNKFFTVSMREIDLWIDGKIRLPKNSVVLTIDDGWFVAEMKNLLEEYDFHATLFLITSLVPPSAYKSDNLEIHSHTNKMHYTGACPGGQGSPIKCLSRETILDDLKTSRNLLGGTTYFSWPFYEYNDYSMNLLKEAGFTMAFKGGRSKATRGINKFLIPRITMHNTTTVSQFASYIN